MADPVAVLKIASGISSILGLVAFLSVLYFFFRREELSQQGKRLELAPLEGRAKLLDEWLTRYGLSAEGLPADKRYNLIKHETERRFALLQARQRGAFIVTMILVVSAGALTASAIYVSKEKEKPNQLGTLETMGKSKVAHAELVRAFTKLLEPFSLLADKQRTIHVSKNIINRESPSGEAHYGDEFAWMHDTLKEIREKDFIDGLQKVPAIARPDELLTPNGATWAGYFALNTIVFEQKLDGLVSQYQLYYDAETLEDISAIKAHRFSRILQSLPGNLQMNIEQGNGKKLNEFTLHFGFFGPNEPETHYLPYFNLIQKVLDRARQRAQSKVDQEL